jgi:hypothetical protein
MVSILIPTRVPRELGIEARDYTTEAYTDAVAAQRR